MTDRLFGIPIQESRWLPKDQAIAFGGDFEKPDNWQDMTPEERAHYALVHGAILIKGIGPESD